MRNTLDGSTADVQMYATREEAMQARAAEISEGMDAGMPYASTHYGRKVWIICTSDARNVVRS